MIEVLKADEGMWVDPQGCYHDTPQDFIFNELGFCGCGMPDGVIQYIRGALRLLAELENGVWKGGETYETWRARVAEFFKGEGAEYFMWYFLDKMELTEHGGSVPGWLTEKGKSLLADLDNLAQEAAC